MAPFDQPMLHGRHHQESHCKNDRAKSAEAEGFGQRAQLRKSVLKECLQLESKQHLCAEDKKTCLIQAGLHFPVEIAGHPKNLTLPAMNPVCCGEFHSRSARGCGTAARNAFGLNRLKIMTGPSGTPGPP